VCCVECVCAHLMIVAFVHVTQVSQAFKGITNNQLYFVAWAQNWCTLRTPASASQQIKTDPHSPGEIRVLGPTSQTPMFADAFQCKATTRYNPATRCSVW
jgi:predicted metalloendopeptidase